jgi:hypothetical protein
MKRCVLLGILALLDGCATGAPTAESTDRAECENYARPFEHSGRMKDACMISRGYSVIYSTNAGWVEVRSKALPRQAPEAIAKDLKGCNDETGMGYVGRQQFVKCMDPRGYAVTTKD